MSKGKVKKFWNKNKDTIVIGAISIVIGGVAGGVLANRLRGEDQILIDSLKAFGRDKNSGRSLVADMIRVQNGSNLANTFVAPGEPNVKRIADIGDAIKDYYTSKGVDLETPVTGLAVFLDKK